MMPRCALLFAGVTATSDPLKSVIALSPIRYLVAATLRHVWRLTGWHSLFPEAELWAVKPLFTLKRSGLEFTGMLTDATPQASWVEDLDQIPLKGKPLIASRLLQAVFITHPCLRAAGACAQKGDGRPALRLLRQQYGDNL
jgi:hypothetical protein